MKSLMKNLTFSAVAATLLLAGGAAKAQPVAQTPLAQPAQTSGSVNPSRSSACGFLANGAAQVLQVNEDFASVNIAVSGSNGLTLFIEGPNGFTECHTTGSTGSFNVPGLLNRGSYAFYVGNANSSVPTSYTLTISQN
ncbi:MAG: hypothetical protein HC929_20695 [Leptolyngbyaceae cyanobacterium SM2_5_2]|nr:hypothetical protein [Leptolyngbyaceae cyanobacterium SM2_5_2]